MNLAMHKSDNERVTLTQFLEKVWRSQGIMWLFVFIMGGIGYWIAPADLDAGIYMTHIQINLPEFNGLAILPINIGKETSQTKTRTSHIDGYHFLVTGTSNCRLPT